MFLLSFVPINISTTPTFIPSGYTNPLPCSSFTCLLKTKNNPLLGICCSSASPVFVSIFFVSTHGSSVKLRLVKYCHYYLSSLELSCSLKTTMEMKKVKSHFYKTDPIIYKVIVDMDLKPLQQAKSSTEYFEKLCRDIIAQQLAGKAAHAIIGRFYKLFEKEHITPSKVLTFSEQELRDVGMSWAKARYIRDLAQKIKGQEVKLNNLHNLDNKSVIEELIKVKGIGSWTAEMFLIFTLGREDIFSHGDLGLRKALQKLYNFKNKPNEKQTNKIVNKWSPYKSYGCLALWKYIDN